MPTPRLNNVVRHVRGLAETAALAEASDGQLLERFAAGREQAAFVALLRRHGPMVLAVGRRLLGQAADAEDVFQATFLLLARKAGSIRKAESVGGWLHGVAHRLAVKARAQRARRQGRERRAATMRETKPDVGAAWRELQELLDEALGQLPEAYRAALVLCYLEGNSHEEAARRLGCPLATLRSRVARGRNLLRARLTRRGLALSAGAVATALTASAAPAGVPAALLRPTLKAAGAFAAGQPAAGAVSEQAARLIEAGLKSLGAGRMKTGLALVLTLGLFAAGAAGIPRPFAAKPPETMPDSGAPPAQPAAARTDRYGDPLPAGALARLGTVRFRHGDAVTGVVLTPDGRTVVSGDIGGWVRVWHAATGREQRRFRGVFGAGVTGLALARDGKTLAARGGDGRVHLLDLKSGKELRPFGRPLESITCFALAADGKTLAVGCEDFGRTRQTLRLWKIATGNELRSLRGHAGRVDAVAFSPDGKRLASFSLDGTVRLWEVFTGKALRPLAAQMPPGLRPGSASCLAFSPDGRVLALGGPDKVIRLWKTATGKEVGRLKGHLGPVAALAVAAGGKTLISGAWDNTLCWWDVATGRRLRQVRGHRSWVTSLALSADGKVLASGAQDCLVRLWDAATGRELRPHGGHGNWVWSFTFSPDGRLVATAGMDGTARVWDATTGRELGRHEGSGTWVGGAVFTPDGEALLTGGEDGVIRLLDQTGHKELGRFRGHKGGVVKFALSPDGRTLASGGNDQSILWDVATRKELRRLEGSGTTTCLAFSPDGRALATAGLNDHAVHLRDVATGKEIRRLEGHPNLVRAVASSPDGRLLASAGYGDATRLWDLRTYRQVRALTRHTRNARTRDMLGIAFSPDGRTLASAEGDGVVILWEVATGGRRRELVGHEGPVHSVAFSADGKRLASGGMDTTALVWDLTCNGPDRRSPDELAARWSALAGSDAAEAYRAVCDLAAAPRDAVPFLRGHLRPVRPADARRLARLMADVGSDRYAVRHKATRELAELGESAASALRQALAGSLPLETRHRLEGLRARLEEGGPEQLRTLRAVEVLERVGSPEARQVLKALAGGVPEAARTREARAALERLKQRPAGPAR